MVRRREERGAAAAAAAALEQAATANAVIQASQAPAAAPAMRMAGQMPAAAPEVAAAIEAAAGHQLPAELIRRHGIKGQKYIDPSTGRTFVYEGDRQMSYGVERGSWMEVAPTDMRAYSERPAVEGYGEPDLLARQAQVHSPQRYW